MSSPRVSAQTIFQAALRAADPYHAIQRALQRDGMRLRVHDREYDLARYDNVYVIGFGKASATMARAIEDLLGDVLTRGWVTVKYGHTVHLATNKIRLHEAGHPLLDENSLEGTRQILEIVDRATENDLIIALVSGGGSALLELPVPGISLADLRAMTDVLLHCGATINEINTLRKHISQVKGGQLARRAQRAHFLALILSDVLGSPLDTIASGPTAPDTTTFADAWSVIEQRDLRAQMPPAILAHLERGVRGEIPDTPKPGDPLFARVHNVIIADLTMACNAALNTARELGYNTLLLSSFVQGEAREFAKFLAAIAREIVLSNRPVAKPACIICGGETTVTLRGKGKGGRNQEIALAAAIEIAGMSRVVVLSGGTDGTDGPTDAAGALTDGDTLARATRLGLDARAFLANNDAYHFFQPLGDLLMTGPTGTNVGDVTILIVEEK
jgi:hydroxypyruvate reductase